MRATVLILIFALGSGKDGDTSPGVGLPASAESARAAAAQQDLPSADSTSALLVFSRDGDKLTDADLEAIAGAATDLTELSNSDFLPPPSISDDGTAAIVVVPLDKEADVAAQAERAVELRTVANADLPTGLTALLTGPEGGLEEKEVRQARETGLQVCTLGKRILRCETAPLCALSAVMYDAGEF